MGAFNYVVRGLLIGILATSLHVHVLSVEWWAFIISLNIICAQTEYESRAKRKE